MILSSRRGKKRIEIVCYARDEIFFNSYIYVNCCPACLLLLKSKNKLVDSSFINFKDNSSSGPHN